jgi:hypothetical protein
MGQARDEEGLVLGEAFGELRREVFEGLLDKHSNAFEFRIKTIIDKNENLKQRLRDYSKSGEQIYIDALKRIEELEGQ